MPKRKAEAIVDPVVARRFICSSETPNSTTIRMSELWEKNESSCDAEIVFPDGAVIKAHKLVLAAASDVFEAQLYTSGMVETVTNRVIVDDIDPSTFRTMLEFIYRGTTEVNDQNATALIYAAKKYDIKQIVTECESFLKSHVNADTCWTLFEQGKLLDCKELELAAYSYILFGNNEMSAFTSEAFLSVSWDILRFFLSNALLHTIGEVELFSCCLKWVRAQPTKKQREYVRLILQEMCFKEEDRAKFDAEIAANTWVITTREDEPSTLFSIRWATDYHPRLFKPWSHELVLQAEFEAAEIRNGGICRAKLKDNWYVEVKTKEEQTTIIVGRDICTDFCDDAGFSCFVCRLSCTFAKKIYDYNSYAPKTSKEFVRFSPPPHSSIFDFPSATSRKPGGVVKIVYTIRFYPKNVFEFLFARDPGFLTRLTVNRGV